MNNKNFKRLSLLNLALGYLLTFAFLLLMMLNRPVETVVTEVKEITAVETSDEALFDGEHSQPKEKEYIYINNGPAVVDRTVYRDHLDGVIIDDPHVAVVRGDRDVIYEHDSSRVVVDDTDYETRTHIGGRHTDSIIHGERVGLHHDDHRISINDSVDRSTHLRDTGLAHGDVDVGLLDRRLAELGDVDHDAYERAIAQDKIKKDHLGSDKSPDDLDFAGLTLAKDGPALGDINDDFGPNGKGYGLGKGGELYAYNFPSRGVGAGIGSSAIGAGAGGGAGLGAGIGQGLLNGESVPTLGGVGDGAKSLDGEPAAPAGVGGLVGGAGAGGAAGLSQGYITPKLGLGVGPGVGSGGGYGNGRGRAWDDKHLPKDGALHIMMHVDGSGSILNTRKQLDIMKETILKEALLPYYNNDENLYNNRVTIVSSSGERTLKFFAEAAKKDNVLAIAFQDEAQPAYHLPNFNKKPEDHYIDDIGKLKSSLNGYNGVYRGVMFQVDRGKTFARSFKEFVGNAFQGKGYLESNNLKKYYRDNNQNHIKNKDGIIFSDEYHAKDSGDPQYYLDLIFAASKKIGLDLNIYQGGLRDGKDTRDGSQR